MNHKYQGLTEQPQGINDLDIYQNVEDAYYGDSSDVLGNTMVYTGPVDVDLNQSPDSVTSKFTPEYNLNNWQKPANFRTYYPTFRFGMSATIDRFYLAISAETSLGNMDGFMLRNFSSIYFSIGYKIWSR